MWALFMITTTRPKHSPSHVRFHNWPFLFYFLYVLQDLSDSVALWNLNFKMTSMFIFNPLLNFQPLSLGCLILLSISTGITYKTTQKCQLSCDFLVLGHFLCWFCLRLTTKYNDLQLLSSVNKTSYDPSTFKTCMSSYCSFCGKQTKVGFKTLSRIYSIL